MPDIKYDSIVILGPTASGKTKLACLVAKRFEGEIISADSRQVYKALDIGTGKDLQEYVAEGVQVPVHLVDIKNAEDQFYLHEFQEKLSEAFDSISKRKKIPVICGGTGLYLDAIRKDFLFTQAPEDHELRRELNTKSKEQLSAILDGFPAENIAHVDRSSAKRMVRGIEVAIYLQQNKLLRKAQRLNCSPFYIGLNPAVEQRREDIALRLKMRLENGLVEEVYGLLQKNISHERLQTLGLEYRFISDHIQGRLTRAEMEARLLTAIIQYSKRQMTWFRRMEKEGIEIHWFNRTQWPEMLAELSRHFTVKAANPSHPSPTQ